MEVGEHRKTTKTTEKPDGTRETITERSFTWDAEDYLAAAGFVVAVGFAAAIIFNLTPVENWELVVGFISAVGGAVAAIASSRKKTARKSA